MRRRAGAQHREVVGDELAGRNPIPSGRARRRPEKPLVVVMSAVSAGFASGGPEPAIEYTGGSVRVIFTLSVSVLVAH